MHLSVELGRKHAARERWRCGGALPLRVFSVLHTIVHAIDAHSRAEHRRTHHDHSEVVSADGESTSSRPVKHTPTSSQLLRKDDDNDTSPRIGVAHSAHSSRKPRAPRSPRRPREPEEVLEAKGSIGSSAAIEKEIQRTQNESSTTNEEVTEEAEDESFFTESTWKWGAIFSCFLPPFVGLGIYANHVKTINEHAGQIQAQTRAPAAW